jgi:hypothetical protein
MFRDGRPAGLEVSSQLSDRQRARPEKAENLPSRWIRNGPEYRLALRLLDGNHMVTEW